MFETRSASNWTWLDVLDFSDVSLRKIPNADERKRRLTQTELWFAWLAVARRVPSPRANLPTSRSDCYDLRRRKLAIQSSSGALRLLCSDISIGSNADAQVAWELPVRSAT